MMEKERRSAPRIRVNLPARWEGVLKPEFGTVTDMSRAGCFVLAGGEVELKEQIWLEIALPDREPVHIWAEVVDHAYEIGFAVRFNSASEEDQRSLASFIEGVFAFQSKKLQKK